MSAEWAICTLHDSTTTATKMVWVIFMWFSNLMSPLEQQQGQSVGRVEQSETRHFLTRAPITRINPLFTKRWTVECGKSCWRIYQAVLDRAALNIFKCPLMRLSCRVSLCSTRPTDFQSSFAA
jgi:hypothetical protein